MTGPEGKSYFFFAENLNVFRGGAVVGLRSTFSRNSAVLHSDFAMFPAQRFWRGTVSWLDVMLLRSNK